MFRYQVLIEYIGTNFVGWQIQSKGKSIQKEIQVKLSKFLKEKVVLIGSGRTDAGVHAIEQSAHFDCKKEIQNLDKLLKSINHFINDKGISVLAIKKRSLKFHARYSAKQRINPGMKLVITSLFKGCRSQGRGTPYFEVVDRRGESCMMADASPRESNIYFPGAPNEARQERRV